MEEAFTKEYVKIEKSLFLVAVGFLHNTEDAKDALQEAAISAYRSYSTLRNKEYFKTWMTRIVINKCKDSCKKRVITESFTDNENVFYEINHSDCELLDAVCRLKSKLSIYITLRFYNDMTFDEMAGVLKLPVSTVKYRTKAAIEELKKLILED